MARSKCFSRFLVLLLVFAVAGVAQLVEGSRNYNSKKVQPKRLFVFGDSYADTGNIPKSFKPRSWKIPYGITFPGKPSGRFSDGRVFTDFVAKFLGLRSPIPYTVRKYAGWKVKYGMNFAFGGTGVFKTLSTALPNMTTQIDFLQQLTINTTCTSSNKTQTYYYSKRDLKESVALVSLAGNDYNAYLQLGGSIQGIKNFTIQVVNQLGLNLKRIHSLGVKKVLVLTLEPIGCLPEATEANSFKTCNSTLNALSSFHNLLLSQAVAELNNETHHHGHDGQTPPFIILDNFSAFTSIFEGNKYFKNALEPCCMGTDEDSSCGSVDDKGNKLYTLCDDPTNKFFWDHFHPSQAGWEAVYSLLTKTLQQIYL